MRRTVVGLFKSLDQCERALIEIEDKGLANNQISMAVKKTPGMHQDVNLVQAENIDVKVVGKVDSGGPLAGALIQGDKDLAESLSYYGIGSERALYLQNRVAEGYSLAVVETDNSKVNQVANILNNCGAHRVEKWSKSIERPLYPHN